MAIQGWQNQGSRLSLPTFMAPSAAPVGGFAPAAAPAWAADQLSLGGGRSGLSLDPTGGSGKSPKPAVVSMPSPNEGPALPA